MASEVDCEGRSSRNGMLSDGEGIGGGGDPDTLTKVEDDLAYCCEKLLNMETLLTELAGRSIDFGISNREEKDTLFESVEMAFELDILSEILSLEAKELQSFILSVRTKVERARHDSTRGDNLEESEVEILKKLHDAEESANRVQELVAAVKKQPMTFEKNLGFCTIDTWADENEELGNGGVLLPSTNKKWISLTVDQQRHVLRQLEKSLARELDLEKKLSDSKLYVEDLMLKLHYTEREFYCVEESVEIYLAKLFEGENAAELLLGISRELIGKLQVLHLNLTNSTLREQDTMSQLQKSMKNCADHEDSLLAKETKLEESLKEAKHLSTSTELEHFSLEKKVRMLEEQQKEHDVQLQLANASVRSSQDQQNTLRLEINQMESLIEGLKAKLSQTSTNAEALENDCLELSRTNSALKKELDFLKNREVEKTSDLEKKLNESYAQLERAKATVEAGKEHQNALYATVADMESTIEELKIKVLKAESRAKVAESKYTLLTDTKIELNEELGFLRGRVDSLESSLRQAEDAKIENAAVISARTKIITDLIMKLAMERVSLQEQVATLAKKQKLLAFKSKMKGNEHKQLKGKGPNDLTDLDFLKSSKVEFQQPSTMNAQVDKSVVSNKEIRTNVSAGNSSAADSNAETVRTIEASQLNWRQFSMIIFVLLLSVLTFYMYHR